MCSTITVPCWRLLGRWARVAPCKRGIGLLAQKTSAGVLTAVAVPSKRWIFRTTWDQFQLPRAFSCIDLYLSDPLFPNADDSLEGFSRRIETVLRELEEGHDPEEVAARTGATNKKAQASRSAA